MILSLHQSYRIKNRSIIPRFFSRSTPYALLRQNTTEKFVLRGVHPVNRYAGPGRSSKKTGENLNRIVVKVGTSTLTNEVGKSNLRAFDRLACVLSDIRNMGYEVILVSSGAIAVGTNKLNMKERPSSMRMKQAAAAVGQCSIIYLYDKFFGDYDKSIAQILLNAEDMEQEEKKETRLPESLGRLPKAGKKPVIDHARSYKEFIGDRPPLPGREALPRWEWDRCLAAGNSRQWRP